jgi:tetratricopeptide (TPR) repeat protein
MMKRALLSILFITVSLFTFSQQGQYGNTPEDSVECVKNYSLYSEFFRQEAYKDAYLPWKETIKYCPKLSKSLFQNGEKMFDKLIAEEKDPKKKEALIDSLFAMYDMRIVNFGEEAYVLGKKGGDMLKYRKDKPKAAYEVLKKSYELSGNEMDAGAVFAFYQALYVMYKNKEATKEEMLELYPKLSEVCKYNVSVKKKDIYNKVQENLDALFAPVADCPDLIKIYTPKFQANPADTSLLETIVKVLEKKDCTAEKLYNEAAVKLFSLKPSAESAEAIANWYAAQNKCADAIEYYKQSADMATDDVAKIKSYIKTAKCYIKIGQFSSARTFAQKALSINPSLGEAYIIIGQAYAASAGQCGDNECSNKAAYWVAVDKFEKARAVDPNEAKNAAELIATYSKHFPDKEKCFFYNITEGSSFSVECWINESTTVRFRKQ